MFLFDVTIPNAEGKKCHVGMGRGLFVAHSQLVPIHVLDRGAESPGWLLYTHWIGYMVARRGLSLGGHVQNGNAVWMCPSEARG